MVGFEALGMQEQQLGHHLRSSLTVGRKQQPAASRRPTMSQSTAQTLMLCRRTALSPRTVTTSSLQTTANQTASPLMPSSHAQRHAQRRARRRART